MKDVLLLSLAPTVILLIWLLPKFQLRSVKALLKDPQITLSEYLKAENDRRALIAQVCAGLAVLGSLFYSGRTLEMQQKGQEADRISKAGEELGNVDSTVNLGGIHALGRIAHDYDEERYSALQILSGYVKEKGKLDHPLGKADCSPAVIEDRSRMADARNQAIIDVFVGEVPRLKDHQEFLEFNHADLRNADFRSGQFGQIQFAGDDLAGAQLKGSHFAPKSLLAASRFIYADLSDTTLTEVQLHDACLAHAHLSRADLRRADLTNADLRSVEDLTGADLTGAILDGADISGSDLSQVKGLTLEQLVNVTCNDLTLFPAYLKAAPKCTLRSSP